MKEIILAALACTHLDQTPRRHVYLGSGERPKKGPVPVPTHKRANVKAARKAAKKNRR